MSPESPEQDTEYTLTPRTEAKYSKIDEDFQIMMQRNQQLAAGQRVTMTGGNYTLPVSVPIPGSYGESGMLQASPQMAHTNISPRPSSSETDSGLLINFVFFFIGFNFIYLDFYSVSIGIGNVKWLSAFSVTNWWFSKSGTKSRWAPS